MQLFSSFPSASFLLSNSFSQIFSYLAAFLLISLHLLFLSCHCFPHFLLSHPSSFFFIHAHMLVLILLILLFSLLHFPYLSSFLFIIPSCTFSPHSFYPLLRYYRFSLSLSFIFSIPFVIVRSRFRVLSCLGHLFYPFSVPFISLSPLLSYHFSVYP